ncbi:hypothetical protein [Caldibacillus debilis]|uniref:Uncharacterized protein n=1 Tax=Caldibacillus debilis GB1 TaxID=1339248 RepID=A0A420VE11_9BACI|nr:hypothetical protein [Caldibacillus debilis]RKO61806.1 hypothetical protein Cdeb_01301 [Caldibacillus debilis GB1]
MLGEAKDLSVKHIMRMDRFGHERIDSPICDWLQKHPHVKIIDIKFSTAAYEGGVIKNALIIYRKEG